MQHNWKLTAAILAVLAVPFALAIRQDARAPGDATKATEPAPELVAAPPHEPAEPAVPPPNDEQPAARAEPSDDIGRDLAGGALCGPAPRPLGDHRAALQTLAEAWGPGIAAPGLGRVWLAPEQRLRAILAPESHGSASLRCEPYLPLALALGAGEGEAIDMQDSPGAEFFAGGARFGFEETSLIGAKADDVVAAYGAAVAHRDDATMLIYLPPVDLALAPTSLQLDLSAGRVSGYALVLEERRADLALQRIEALHGPARRDGERFVFGDGAVSLEVDAYGGLLTLRGR